MTILTPEQFAAEKDATLTSIIERMYDNPEEFNDTNRWHWLTSRINSRRNDDMNGASQTNLPFLTPKEFQRLWDAYMYVSYRNFAKETARAIMNPQTKRDTTVTTGRSLLQSASQAPSIGLSSLSGSNANAAYTQALQTHYQMQIMELEHKLREAQREADVARGAYK